MNPDRNVQVILASMGKLRTITSPVKSLLVVPAWKKRLSFVLKNAGNIRIKHRLMVWCQTMNR